ncbi:MAG: VOC family protein [Candidatus Synoicihabitans palmerolidicus]|nr:VOC family protein [Candidatus Synoicihabitans palmerolidicus]
MLTTVTLVVRDYDEALEFYVGRLGFTLIEDTPVPSQQKRWVVIAPAGTSGCRLLLAVASNDQQRSRVGNQTGGRVSFFFHTKDFQRDYAAYRRQGVRFLETPRHMSLTVWSPYLQTSTATVGIYCSPRINLLA